MQVKSKLKTKRQKFAIMVFILFAFLASGFNLKMEFTSQAPEGNWGEPWYNDCEEVSIAMVDSFYNNRILTPVIAKKEILRIIVIKEKAFGPSLEENSDQNASLINNYLNSNWKARVIENPTIEQIKEQINKSQPVILPVDGRKLDNRYFTTIHYHVFVISGYDDDKKMFITQEPGTYRGHDYKYSYAVIENAMRDYNSVDLSKGRRVAIFTGLKIEKIKNSVNEKKDAGKIDKIENKTNIEIGEVKKDNLSINLENIAEDKGFVKTMENYRNYIIDRIAKILKAFLGVLN